MSLQQDYIRARKAVITRYFSALNDKQQEAVLAVNGPLLLLAGAGSGKTTVLIHRVENLIRFGIASESEEIPANVTEAEMQALIDFEKSGAKEIPEPLLPVCAQEPVYPWKILAITFTNKAANELKDRLSLRIGPDSEGVWAMTFHSACCRILRRDIDRLGYTSDFTIYDTSDSQRVMKSVISSMGFDEKIMPAKTVLNAISRAKDRHLGPQEYLAEANENSDYRAEQFAEAYRRYQNQLRGANALDFDDIIFLTVTLLEQDEEVLNYYQHKFRYILVDEYQDTNRLQYKLIALLGGYYHNVCVVGDDDQSIYKFRGATIENILNFQNEYADARLIRLEQNYRSTKYILEAANAVIANNSRRMGKNLWTDREDGSRIVLRETGSESDEAIFVSNAVLNAVARGGHFRDHAVLYRTNAQSNAIEIGFKSNGIPYRIIGGTRFYDRAEVKDLLAYLSVINNTTDDLRLLRIVNNPPRGIGGKTLEMVNRQAAASGRPVFDILANADCYPSLEKAEKKLKAFTDMINDLRASLQLLSLPDFYDLLLEKCGYLTLLTGKDTPENESRKENVMELKSSIINYCEKSDDPSLRGFLEEVSLYTDIDKYDADADAAVMMTVHSAKGLEFPSVYMVGMEDGLFPGSKVYSESDELEEERRLCYVAMTRAKDRLYIFHARQRMLYGRTTMNRVSRFVEEIPEDCVEAVKKPARTNVSASRTGFYSQSAYGAYFSGSRGSGYPPKYTKKPAAPATPLLDLHKGDQIIHNTFGEGLVTNVNPMCGDALLEIAFDTVGTKKFMLKTASAHMKKK